MPKVEDIKDSAMGYTYEEDAGKLKIIPDPVPVSVEYDALVSRRDAAQVALDSLAVYHAAQRAKAQASLDLAQAHLDAADLLNLNPG